MGDYKLTVSKQHHCNLLKRTLIIRGVAGAKIRVGAYIK